MPCLISGNARTCTSTADFSGYTWTRPFSHTIASLMNRSLAPLTNRNSALQHTPSLITGAHSHDSSHGQPNIRFVTALRDKFPSTRVQCSVRVQGLVKRGEWLTFLALKFVHTDKFWKRRVVYLAVDKPEPDAIDELAQWPEKSFLEKQRNTEIQVLSSQSVGEKEPIPLTLKVTQRSDYSGRLFWREVLDLSRHRAIEPPAWKTFKKGEFLGGPQNIRLRFLMRRRAKKYARDLRNGRYSS